MVRQGVGRAPEPLYLALPLLAVGFSSHHMEFGSITLLAATYLRPVVEPATCLYRHRSWYLVFIDGYDGNPVPLRMVAE